MQPAENILFSALPVYEPPELPLRNQHALLLETWQVQQRHAPTAVGEAVMIYGITGSALKSATHAPRMAAAPARQLIPDHIMACVKL